MLLKIQKWKHVKLGSVVGDGGGLISFFLKSPVVWTVNYAELGSLRLSL